MATSSAYTERYDIEIADCVHDVYRYDRPVPGSARVRMLMFPDFDGAQGPTAARLAQAYSETCNAEVIQVDLYGKYHKPQGYDSRADSVIRHARAYPLETRQRLHQISSAVAHLFRTDAPLITVGFCFGGTLAFELARTDPSVVAAISIHGDPSTLAPVAAASVRASFTAIIGSRDPLISNDALGNFMQEAETAQLRWQLLTIGGARHSFTKKEMIGGNWAMRYDRHADDLARLHVAALSMLHAAQEVAAIS